MHTMRLILWGLHHVQGLSLHQFCQLNHHILLQGLKWCTQLHPSYLLTTIVAILPIKLVNVTFLLRISFVIIVGKRTRGSCLFCQVPRTKAILITIAKFASIFRCPSTKSQGCQGFLVVGFGKDLSDTRSGLFTDMVRVITWA
jgi:hypothetical protein